MSELKQTALAGVGRILRRLFPPLLVLMAVVSVNALSLTNLASVTLAWDRSTDDQLTNGITYKVYASQPLFPLTATNVLAGTNTAVTFTNLSPGMWRFYAVAVHGGLESIPSNLAYTIIPTNAPVAPGKFATVYLESKDVLTSTNWSPFGNFRARIYIP